MKSKLLCIAAAVAAQTAMAQSVNVIEQGDLRLHVFLSKPVIFQVASVLVEGPDEVALVDAQFSADNAQTVVEMIRATGKPLKTIFISHSDPDYYFGLGVVADAFPSARILATPQTKWMIEATSADKLEVWAPQLGNLAPKRIVTPEALVDDHFTVSGVRVEVRRLRGDEGHSWLWIPSARTILGGVYLSEGQHLWVADSPTPADRRRWLEALDAMDALGPQITIPAHFSSGGTDGPAKFGTRPVDFTRRYLVALDATLAMSTDSAGVIARMKSLYPGLDGESSLEMTAKVLKGEMPWRVVTAFPPIGRKAEVDFGGEYLFELDFTVPDTLTFRGLKPRAEGRPITDTVKYKAVWIAPGVWMVYWTERDNTHVVHVEDYGSGIAYTNITAPNGSFTNLRGKLRLLE